MKTIIIRTEHEDRTEWGLSFSDSNPEAKDYFEMPNQETAERLQIKLNHIQADIDYSNESFYLQDVSINKEIYKALEYLKANNVLLSIIGSRYDTLDDKDVLSQLEEYNVTTYDD